MSDDLRFIPVVNSHTPEWDATLAKIADGIAKGFQIPIRMRPHDLCEKKDGTEAMYAQQVRCEILEDGSWKYIGNVIAEQSKVEVDLSGYQPLLTGERVYSLIMERMEKPEPVTIYAVSLVLIDINTGYTLLMCADEPMTEKVVEHLMTTNPEVGKEVKKGMEPRNVKKHAGETTQYAWEGLKDAGRTVKSATKTGRDIVRLISPAAKGTSKGIGKMFEGLGKALQGKKNKEKADA